MASSVEESLLGAGTWRAGTASLQRIAPCQTSERAFQATAPSVKANESCVDNSPPASLCNLDVDCLHLRRGSRARTPQNWQAKPTPSRSGADSASPTLASSRTQLALVSHEVSGNELVIQSAVVHRALFSPATLHNMRDPPPQHSASYRAPVPTSIYVTGVVYFMSWIHEF